MNDTNELLDPELGPRLYQVLCFTALGGIFLVQLQQGFALENLLLAAVGALGILRRLRSTPYLLLLVIFATHLIRQAVWRSPGRTAAAFDLSDLLLCGAVLVFIACHYRLQSLTLNVVPLDPRRRQGRPRWVWLRLRRLAALEPHGRSTTLVTATEIITLLIWLPFCVFLAQLLWMGLGRQWMFYNFPLHISRIMAAGGGLGLGILVASGLYRFWGHRHMRPTEAALYLQDTLWRETRREQRRHLRWLAWRNLRAKEKR